MRKRPFITMADLAQKRAFFDRKLHPLGPDPW
jgi:hypothetical protein